MTRIRVVPDRTGLVLVEREAAQVTGKVVAAVADDARRFVPKDTWELHNSIEEEWGGGTVGYVTVGGESTEQGPGAYWDSVEYGQESNASYPEQPYLRPAVYVARQL